MASNPVQPFAQIVSELLLDDAIFLGAVEEVEAIRDAMASDDHLQALLVSPAIPRTSREGLVRRALEAAELNDVVVKTVVMLIRKNVIGEFKAFATVLRDMADQRCGIARGTVSTAVDLSKSAQETIEKMVSESLGKVAALHFMTDPDLLGGVRLRMRELELDASYRKQLQNAKTKLKKMRA
jgi:F-type H+-transporting ATPase subunit delta